MCKFSHLFCLCFFGLTTVAQPPSIQWQKTYGGTLDDYSNSIIYNGSKYLIGATTNSFNGNVSGHHGNIGEDAWLLEVNSNGTYLVQKCFGGISDESISFACYTLTGGKIFIGKAYYNDGDVNGVHGTTGDVWIVNTDSMNNILWQHCYGGFGTEHSIKILTTSDGGFVFVSHAEGDGGDISGCPGGQDVWVVKIDSLGVIQWQNCLGSTLGDEIGSIIKVRSGGYLVYGYHSAYDGDVTCAFPSPLGTVWMVKISDTGNIEWDKCYLEENGVDLVEVNNGFVFLAKVTSGHCNGYSDYEDFWVYKMDSLGNVLYSQCLGGSWFDAPHAIAACVDGGVVVIGTTESTDNDAINNHGSKDVLVAKLDSVGNVEWTQCYGGSQDDEAYSIVQTSDGGLVFTGYTKSNDGDITSVPHGGKDVWVVKLAPPTNGIGELGGEFYQFNSVISSNVLELNFNSKVYSNFHLAMYDMLGKKIFTNELKIVIGENKFHFQVNAPGGVYIIQFGNETLALSKKVLSY